MPISINETKTFCVKYVVKGGFQPEMKHVDALGRTDAGDMVRAEFPGCEILDCWQTPKTLGGFRLT